MCFLIEKCCCLSLISLCEIVELFLPFLFLLSLFFLFDGWCWCCGFAPLFVSRRVWFTRKFCKMESRVVDFFLFHCVCSQLNVMQSGGQKWPIVASGGDHIGISQCLMMCREIGWDGLVVERSRSDGKRRNEKTLLYNSQFYRVQNGYKLAGWCVLSYSTGRAIVTKMQWDMKVMSNIAVIMHDDDRHHQMTIQTQTTRAKPMRQQE